MNDKITEVNQSLVELEEELSKIKSASKMISDAKNTTEKSIIETKKITKQLIDNSNKATDITVKESKKLIKAATSLLKSVDILMEKLDKVDFPIRLDKLDTTISVINASIQNVISRLDLIEKNIKDDFDNKIKQVQVKLEETQKTNLFFLIVILVVVIFSTFIILN